MRTAPVIAIVVAALLSAAPRLAQAQSDYPIRPVSLIVPYASGGVADVAMRLLGDKLSNRLGQQFVIENRPGAGGIVAAQTAAGAPADGYTLLMTGNNNAIAAALFTSLPYNVLTDFTSVSNRFVLRSAAGDAGRLAAAFSARCGGSGARQPGQIEHRHHQSRQYAESCGRAVRQHGRD